MQITLANSLAVWPIACASGERCCPMAVRLFTPRLHCCALWPQWQCALIAVVSLGLPLFPHRSCSLSSVSLLPRLSHFSESAASGERPWGSKVLPWPPRPQPLTASEISDDRRLWHISGQPPSGFGPEEKVHTSRFWRRSLGEKIARHKAVMG